MTEENWRKRVALVSTQSATTVIIDGGKETYTVHSTNPLIKEFFLALEEGRLEDLGDIMDRSQGIQRYTDKKVTVRDGVVYMGEEALPDTLSNKIVEMMDGGYPFQPFLTFWDKLQSNPYEKCKDELYKWMERNQFAITLEGTILAYKVVTENPYKGEEIDDEKLALLRNSQTARMAIPDEEYREKLMTRDYIDIHSRSFPQGVGDVVSVSREEVDPEGRNTCSKGLHVCGWDYTKQFGSAFTPRSADTVIYVTVSPEDWISIPHDDLSKARVCRYTIVGVNTDLTEERRTIVATTDINTASDDSSDDEEDYEYEEEKEEEENYDGDDYDDSDLWEEEEPTPPTEDSTDELIEEVEKKEGPKSYLEWAQQLLASWRPFK